MNGMRSMAKTCAIMGLTMRQSEEQALLEQAAAPILELIRKDRDAADVPPVRSFFRHLEKHLFDPDFDLDRWLRSCDIGEELMRHHFERQTGIDPATYLWDRRLHTASRLLRDTSLSVTAVGELVGYSGRQAFSEAFETWLGERPAVYRQDARREVEKYGLPPEEMLSETFLQRLEAGWLNEDEVELVRARLRHIREQMEQDGHVEKPADVDPEEVRFEQLRAQDLWRQIAALSFEDQKSYVENLVGYRTMAVRDLLWAKSYEVEGQARREREMLAACAEEAVERA